MPKIAKPTADELAETVKKLPPPRSQADWRAASHAMREARRALGPGREFTRTISLDCGSERRRMDLWGNRMAPYNGPSRLFYVGMIRHHRTLYKEGDCDGRLKDARLFAAAARAQGPIRIPG